MRHTSRIPIRFADIDAMGHVNNAIYLNYFEQARIDWFQSLIGKSWDWQKYGVLLARNEVDYIAPVLLQDDLYIETIPEKIGNKSLVLCYEVFVIAGDGGHKVVARGKSILVCYDHQSQQTIPVPDEWREKLIEA